ncbi:MAG: nucleotidyltransferase domain-containing protein [Deltaproteobacteria bacterium]|nr:nucleotidyltransferase domain-containing protein [Deltaproteobacteria bacterium]
MESVDTATLNDISTRIVSAIHPQQIILFGSHAWGHPHCDSDIDVFVVVDHSDLPSYRRAREVYRSLRGLKLPVEVVVRTRSEVTRALRVKTSLERKVFDEGRFLHGCG